jgi:hypothetical protein
VEASVFDYISLSKTSGNKHQCSRLACKTFYSKRLLYSQIYKKNQSGLLIFRNGVVITLTYMYIQIADAIVYTRKLLDSQIYFSNLSFLLVVFFFSCCVFFDQLVSLEDSSLQFRAAIDVDSRLTLPVDYEVTNCRKWGDRVYIQAYTTGNQ